MKPSVAMGSTPFVCQISICYQKLVVFTLHLLVGSCYVVASLVENRQPDFVGCLPCSHEYITASYFENHNTLLDSEFHGFLAQKIGCDTSCKGLDHDIIAVELSDFNRLLSGEGSHRRLISTMKFDVYPGFSSWLDDHICELLIIERLPIGVFADPFELQHLVQRRVYLGASVFGDTNLELPSALSNRSIVEMHIDIGRDIPSETVVELPLHARYPPLDVSGYADVTISEPDLFLRCRQKELRTESCLWTVSSLGAESTNSLIWSIPCGNGEFAGIVSSLTFISALVSSLSIVLSAICFSKKNDIKVS